MYSVLERRNNRSHDYKDLRRDLQIQSVDDEVDLLVVN